MTNEQLSLLLYKYTAALELEIVKLRQVLPDDLERHEQPRMSGDPGQRPTRWQSRA